VPVFANGDIFTRQDAEDAVAIAGVDGVMAARGLLENPGKLSAPTKIRPRAFLIAMRSNVCWLRYDAVRMCGKVRSVGARIRYQLVHLSRAHQIYAGKGYKSCR
jgi:tRNA-dihydrouridine synthase